MGCAASSDDSAERRRRWRALGRIKASTTGLPKVGQDKDPAPRGRRGCKVAPEPKEQQEDPTPERAMPGSPSFRHYCQKKEAAIDALVSESEAVSRNGSIRITVAETSESEAPKTNEHTAEDTSKTKNDEASKPKQVTKWLRFRGLAIVAAWYKLFSRHRGKASTHDPSPADAKSHPPGPAPAAKTHV